MPTIEEHGNKVSDILNRVHAHADTMEKTEYADVDALKRDMAIGVELGQQYVDALGEILDDEEWREEL